MAKKDESPEKQIQRLVKAIEKSIEHWKDIKDNGCYDPSWADGCNMNLVRNHIMHYRRMIAEICNENGFELPDVMGVPIPPEVDNQYMADLRCSRASRLRQFRERLVHYKIEYNECQLTLF